MKQVCVGVFRQKSRCISITKVFNKAIVYLKSPKIV